MFKDDFKERYTTIPFAIYRAYCHYQKGGVISHRHREIELIALTKGAADFYIDGTAYRLQKGDVLVVPPYSIHRAETDPSMQTAYNCICFDLSVLSDESFREGLLAHTLSLSPKLSEKLPYTAQLQAWIETACYSCEKKEEGWELEAVGCMSLFFGTLKRNGCFKEQAHAKKENLFAHTVYRYISEHFKEDLTSKDLAKATFMNASYFCRLFKKNFGCCFSEYLLAYRLEKAKIKLKSTSSSVTNIALDTGFHSASYFGHSFKERFGISPLTYRKENA